MDGVEPDLILGNEEGTNGSHRDAVIALSLNSFQKQVLASGSADSTIKIWDLSSGQVVNTHSYGGKRPEVVKWHHKEQSILFVASDDRKLRAADIRTQKEIGSCNLGADIESFSFDSFSDGEIHLSLNDGSLVGVDLKKGFKASYQKNKESRKALTSVSANFKVPGMLCASSMDSILRLYDTRNRDKDNCPVRVDTLQTQGVSLKTLNCSNFFSIFSSFSFFLQVMNSVFIFSEMI